MSKVIGLKADADIYAINCAREEYGDDLVDEVLDNDENNEVDEEGNPIYPVFDGEGETNCSHCGTALEVAS